MNLLLQILLVPVMMNSSLLCRNLLVLPSLILMGLVSYQLSSSVEPYESAA